MIPVFMKILSMSAVGSVVILAVLLARLLLKKAPRAAVCALWLAVLFRLLCPWSPESRFGGVARTASVSIETRETVTLPAVDTQTGDGPATMESTWETPSAVVQPSPEQGIGWQEIGCCLWILGMGALAVYSLSSLLRLRRRLVGAVRLRDNLYLADHLETAFVLGLVRPKIYLPSSLSAQEQNYILAHEQAHIRRGDPWWKALAFLALTVHWFNPLVWLAFVLSGRDMETACDEAVIRKLGPEIGADYAASLLRLATGRRILAGAPLAFGEGDTSGRIRHILRYKKPAFWVALLSALAVVILGLFLTFDRTTDTGSDYWNARYTVREVRYDAPMYNFAYTEDTAPEYAILPDGDLYARDTEGRDLIYGQDWTYVGTLAAVQMDRQERNALFDPSNNTVQEIMDNVTAVYEAQWQVSGAVQQNFHYLMVTRQGQLYLTVGHSAGQVRWLFRLEYAASVEEYELKLPVRQSSSYPINVSDGLRVRGASWASAIWPELYPDRQVPAEDELPSISLPSGQQMLILDLEDLDSGTLTVGLSPNGGPEETTVLNQDSDGSFYWFLPEAQTMRCRVIFEDCCYAFRVVTETAAATGNQPYTDLAYNLTDEGPLTLPVSRLTGYSCLFWTNSTKIKVKNRSDSASLHVEILTPESREDHIMLADVEPGKSVSFTNLTAAQVYALRITGDPDAEVTISD